MKHSYHAALVIYQENDNPAPSSAWTPTAPSPLPTPPILMYSETVLCGNGFHTSTNPQIK